VEGVEMKKDKICFIDPKFLKSIGGVETHGYEFVKHFLKDKEFQLNKIFAKKEVNDGINLEISNRLMEPRTIRNLSGDFKKDAKSILKNTKDTKIYFFNNPNWLPMAEYIKKSKPKSKVFVRSGGNDMMAGWIGCENSKESLLKNREFLVSLINNYVDFLIANSNFSRERMISVGIKPKKIKVIRGGVDCNLFKPSKRQIEKIMTISYWGRWVEFKGLEFTLKTIKEVYKRDKNIRFIMIGDGPERNSIFKLIHKLKLKEIVDYKGLVEFSEIPSLVRDSEIFLHLPICLRKRERGSSYIHTETMGRTYCEATSLGMACVISDVGGGPEIINNSINGFVVPEKDYKLAAKKILGIIGNKKLREKMGKNGRHIALKKFDWKILIKKYKDLLKE
jgi:glycosyltransferase involved in cell wall biosynthesis